MKKKIVFALLVICLPFTNRAAAQATEVVQLLLNVEKLSQFKQILSDMKAGYDILDKGYGTIKNISQGNFSMHELFLDGLYAVNPSVRKYGRVTDIINDQVFLVSEYRRAYDRFRSANIFQPKEISYIGNVYSRLVSSSLDNLDDLINVITANKLRMSDDERIASIDRIYTDMQDKLQFLRSFNNSTSIMAMQRKKALLENQTVEKIYGIN
ncbi:TerB family tellurite resistance protein [Taibaiella koreensis]|uniref:TerB family tellurite resistance protein n=1 Tax=Taibaiella koreensis TaxID=1268548 RepID=UPI000E599414|nr:TerB family tellurite resistance protein [Taibaiella koreensis]